MPSSTLIRGRVPSAGNVPFIFGVCAASALPGPILTSLLLDLGMSQPAARTLLSRLKNLGSLSVSHIGRVGIYRLAGRMASSFHRIRRGPERHVWDGQYRTIIFDIGESERALKDKLRYATNGLGFGQLRSGVLISPYDKAQQLDHLLHNEVLNGFIAYGTLKFDTATAKKVAMRAWDLAHIAAALDVAVRETQAKLYTQLPPASDREAFQMMHQNAMSSLTVRLTDPGLPKELLPDGWAAVTLDEALAAFNKSLAAQVGAHISAVIDASPHSDLVERLQ